MNSLNTIPSQGTFGNIATFLNANFDTIRGAIGQVEYSTTKCRGMYATSSALETAVSSPKVGDWALVGNSFPADIYVCNTAGTWVDSGNNYDGDNVVLTGYVTQANFNDHVDASDENITTLFSYFSEGGVVATHTTKIQQLYSGVSSLNTTSTNHQTQINDIQRDLNTATTGLKARMSTAEADIATLKNGVRQHDTTINGHQQAISDLQADVRNITAAISLIGPGQGGGSGLSIQAMTQAAYDALATKDENTLYIII